MNPLTEVTSVIQNINIACRVPKLFGWQSHLDSPALPVRRVSTIRRSPKIPMFVLSVITLVLTLSISPQTCKAGPIIVGYLETPDVFILTIDGNAFAVTETHTIALSGTWMITVNITETVGANDMLAIIGAARHIVGPHGEGQNPVGFAFNFIVNGGAFAAGNHVLPPKCDMVAHGEHLDQFCADLSFTNTVFNDITGYKFKLRGEHVVPEPATLILLGTGLIGVGAAARRRRKIHKSEDG